VLALVLLAALAILVQQSPGPIQAVRHLVFDGYQRLFPLERVSHPVTIVVIDEPSLARYGQWPWPRTRVAELVDAIAQQKPAAIGLDLFFPEPDRFSPESLAREVPALPDEFAAWLRSRRGNDELLAETIAGKRVVLGVTGGDPDPRFSNPPRGSPVRITGAVPLMAFGGHIGTLEAIDRVAAGRGLINSGPGDQVVRNVPYFAMVQGVVVPSLGIETLRVALESPPLALERKGAFAEFRFGEVRQRLQSDGTAWIRMGPHDPARFVSAVELLSGKASPESLRDKIVLVGNTGLGLLDFKTTPLGDFVPGVEIHAQIVENLFNGESLARPDFAVQLEALALIACGLIVVLWVPRLSALEGANVVAGLIVLLIGAGLIAFRNYGLLLDPLWPGIGTVAVFGSVIVGTLSIAERQRRQLRDQAARMAGEMDAARRIQMGLLPNPADTQAGDPRFQLAALLEPARTVGGDFYDCFRIDNDRIFIVVGDVSGKGLPSALFMASVKSQIKSTAARVGEVGAILSVAQREIAHENPEQLFVTAFAGIFDAASGELAFSNAGHEPPFARAPGGVPKRVVDSGGPPLGALDGFEFPTSRYQFQPGEWLCVVTDGATEAVNRQREFFGTQRVVSALGSLADDASADEVIRKLRSEVATFADGAEAADDLTLLALRWSPA
jgi:adenylate cyclase